MKVAWGWGHPRLGGGLPPGVPGPASCCSGLRACSVAITLATVRATKRVAKSHIALHASFTCVRELGHLVSAPGRLIACLVASGVAAALVRTSESMIQARAATRDRQPLVCACDKRYTLTSGKS